jgi:hypothetical protein
VTVIGNRHYSKPHYIIFLKANIGSAAMITLPPLPPLQSKALFGICNALLDITAEVDHAYLDK